MTAPRRSSVFLSGLAGAALLAGLARWDAGRRRDAMQAELATQAELVRLLDLTDLCLTTEARYTRHPSQSDPFSPFQDHPRALEHFPSGSWIRVRR